VFLTGKVIAGDDHDRCVLAPREALNVHGVRPRRGRLHRQVT
jgi:hypothetical protein